MRLTNLAPLSLLLLAAACSSSPYKHAKEDMMESKEDYKECLKDHDGNAGKCEAERINHETDMEALKSLKQ